MDRPSKPRAPLPPHLATKPIGDPLSAAELEEAIMRWRRRIVEIWRHMLGNRQFRRLAECTNEFLRTEHAPEAVAAGWCEGQLFAWRDGLVPFLARTRCRLIRIELSGALYADLTGGQDWRERVETDAPAWFFDPKIVPPPRS